VTGYRFEGERFDCGSKAGFLQATVSFALARPDLSDEFGRFLSEIVPVARAAE
jgi:UTP--glucose-1-phosphate uridylyltransferase